MKPDIPYSTGVPWDDAMAAGQYWYRAGDLDRARGALREAVAIDPYRMPGWTNLGVVLLAGGLAGEAIEAFRRALELEPDSALIHLNLGDAMQEAGDIQAAYVAYHQAISLEPNANGLNKLGGVLRSQWRLSEADEAFLSALRLEPGHEQARANLAITRICQGRMVEARLEMDRLLAGTLSPEAGREVGRARRMLEEWQRLDPLLVPAFRDGRFDELAEALASTPEDLLEPDSVVTPFMEKLAENAAGIGAARVHSAASVIEFPTDWPLIEACFSIQLCGTLEEYRALRAGRELTLPRLAMEGASAIKLAAYVDAVRMRRSGVIADLMISRPEIALRYVHWLIFKDARDSQYFPGHFKPLPNVVLGNLTEPRAQPERLVGCLRQYFGRLLPAVADPMARAVLLRTLIIKTHCFFDGNGRTASFMMNAELERNGLPPVLIPAYLETRLVKASREVYRTLDCSPMLDLMAEARAFTDTILSESAPVGGCGHPSDPAQAV